MKALVFGATGLVGNELVKLLVRSDAVSEVITLSRRPILITSPKLTQRVFNDITQAGFPSDIDVVFNCLGTTLKKAGSKENFRKVDLELVLSLAQKAKDSSVSTFISISSLGAKVGHPSFYLRTKGQCEEGLKNIGFKKLIIVRPSLLLGQRGERRIWEDIGQKLAGFASIVLPSRLSPIAAHEVAKSLLELSLKGNSKGSVEYEIFNSD